MALQTNLKPKTPPQNVSPPAQLPEKEIVLDDAPANAQVDEMYRTGKLIPIDWRNDEPANP